VAWVGVRMKCVERRGGTEKGKRWCGGHFLKTNLAATLRQAHLPHEGGG